MKFAFFDFDYTLAKTSECIRVFSPRGTRKNIDGENYRIVNPQEYNNLILADDEKIKEKSFEEFNSLNIGRTIPIQTSMFLYKTLYSDFDTVQIISARPKTPSKSIKQYMEIHTGILAKDHTFYGFQGSDPTLKTDHIDYVIANKEIESLWLLDDSDKVIHCYLQKYNSINNCRIIKVEHKIDSVNYIVLKGM